MSALKEAEIRVKVLVEEGALLAKRIEEARATLAYLSTQGESTPKEMIANKAYALVASKPDVRIVHVKALIAWHTDTFGSRLPLMDAKHAVYAALERFDA